MAIRLLRTLGFVSILAFSACGSASVQYGSPLSTPTAVSDPDVAAILAAASNGSQTLTLPNSRLIIVGTITAAPGTGGRNSLQNSGQSGGADPPVSPSHAAPGDPIHQPLPVIPPKQSSADAAANSGGPPPPKSTDSTTPPPSVTTTLTSDYAKYAVNVVQLESVVAFTVRPTNNFLSKNDFSVSRLANTRIPTTVSNTFTDETAARVQSIASIVGALLPLAGAEAPRGNEAQNSPGCLSDDMVIDDSILRMPPSASGQTSGANFGGWKIRKTSWHQAAKCLDVTVTADPVAPNLVPIAALKEAFSGAGGAWTKVWPVPACMNVHVTIYPIGVADITHWKAEGEMSVIDPDYVELMPLPQKGKIVMHPICGADLADTATDPYAADFATINAIVAAFPAKKTNK